MIVSKERLRRGIATLLAVLMLLSVLPVSALAEGETPTEGPAVSTEAATTDTTNDVTPTGTTETSDLTTDPAPAEEVTNKDGETASEQPAEDVVLVDRTSPEDAVKFNDDLYLTGIMPTDAVVDVQPVDVDINGTTPLLAYNITVYASEDHQNEGREWQPDGDAITVSLPVDPEIKKVDVYHLSDIDATPEYVGTYPVVDGRVEFEADSFSVYAVIDHEEGTVNTPRVEFHFINPYFGAALTDTNNSTAYYAVAPYEFKNKHNDTQTTQILKSGEKLELITDPGNQTDTFFYGWYVVNPYVCSETDAFGVGTNGNLYYTWPGNPNRVDFETAISIAETDVQIGDTVNWTLGEASGSGIVDGDGNLHVFLAPLYEKYNFINFMLYSRSSDVNNLMTRKLAAVGSSEGVDVKISDVRSNSKDSVHLLFAGWEYNNGTEWVKVPTIDHTGAEIKDPGRDGVYLDAHLADTSSIDLYPLFIEARWIDFTSGLSGSGATFVGSRYLEAWGAATTAQTPEEEGKNVASSLEISTRAGYNFGGWYAFAVMDQTTGEITNLTTPQDVTVTYIDSDYHTHSVTINTTAIPITDGTGAVIYDGTYALTTPDGSVDLFSATGGKLKLHDALDRLSLTAKWNPAPTDITIVYWLENALDDNFTASAIKALDTDQLSQGLSRAISSGSVLTLEDLKAFADPDTGICVVDRDILDEVGAVEKKVDPTAMTAREDIFFDLDETRSDVQTTINGDGSSVFNVYFKRKVFKLVFHIGRDGYTKEGGNQKITDVGDPDGNWAEFMYKDSALTAVLHHEGRGTNSKPNNVSMTYVPENKTVTSAYELTEDNIKGDYVPADDENVYVIEAKYGAYIGDRWPTPVNPNFIFQDDPSAQRTMYTWAYYYNTLYSKIARSRSTYGNAQGANPDINGIYNYMSGELISKYDGNEIVNENQVVHVVAYYGNSTNTKRFKQYHSIFEAIDGTYDPNTVELHHGTDYSGYPLTTWSQAYNQTQDGLLGHIFYEDPATSPKPVISNLEPQFQNGWEYDGYEYFYSCYDPVQQNSTSVSGQKDYHIYFFYRPKQYKLTFKYERAADVKEDTYYYKQLLAEAKKYADPEKEGYVFLGWYTNEAGVGEPFDFANEIMPCENLILYPVFQKLNYMIRIDPNGAEIDHWRASTGASTGFRADYNEAISSYDFLERNFIQTNDEEIAALGLNSDQIFYYYKTVYRSEALDGTYIPARLRDALYLTASEVDEYWAFYQSVPENEFTRRGAHKYSATEKDDWMDAYFGGHDLATLPKYRRLRGAEHYSFMGWYPVIDGKVSSVPFNFNTLITEDLEIRAMWRLDGGYYLLYNPEFYYEDTVNNTTIRVVGNITHWTDPENPSLEVYSDQARTQILHAPKDVPGGWVFRGWRIVKKNGTKSYTDSTGTHEYDNWEPMELDSNGASIYYQPGENFVIDSQYVTDNPEGGAGAIIHVQAYYEPVDTTFRRPDVTNLTLDANQPYGGYLDSSAGSLPTLDWTGSTDFNLPYQILIGDFQSNAAVHLYKYATTKEFNGITGIQFFKNDGPYTLLGFDPSADPENPSTGSAFVPAYSPDSVISVTRDDNVTLYALWEPKIYVTFVNTTDKPITINLSGTGTDTVRIVNAVTGEYDREAASSTIVVPAKSGDVNGQLKIVLPTASTDPNVSDAFTATSINDHPHKKMSVSGTFEGAPHGTGSVEIPDDYPVIYTAPLKLDANGITVTYTEVPDTRVIFDVGNGIWTETSDDYKQVEDLNLYAIEASDIIQNNNNYEPADPGHATKVFIGWTEYEDIAARTDFSATHDVTWGETVITIDNYASIMEKIKAELLWDFSQDPPYEKTLYAVYSDAVTVTFDLTKTGSQLHNWTGPALSNVDHGYVFYQDPSNPRLVTYRMAVGELLPKPVDPSPNSGVSTWGFLSWVTVNSLSNTTTYANNGTYKSSLFNFANPVSTNQTIYTSWTKGTPQQFTFNVENHVVNGNPDDTFTYNITVTDAEVWGKLEAEPSKNTAGPSDTDWGTFSVDLKNNEMYTVLVTVKYHKPGSWDGCSVIIKVLDSNGNIIKDGLVTRANRNGAPDFVGGYRYYLSISQDGKDGYVTDVSMTGDDFDMVTERFDYPEDTRPLPTPEHGLLFASRWGSDYETGNAFSQTFVPSLPINGYVGGQEKTISLVFTNTRTALIAPTDVRTNAMPFALMALFGTALCGGAVVSSRARKRHRNH